MSTRALLLALLAAAVPIAGRAQEPPRESDPPLIASVSGGLGVGSPALGGQASVAVSHRSGDYVLRVAGATDFDLYGPSETAEDVAVGNLNRARSFATLTLSLHSGRVR